MTSSMTMGHYGYGTSDDEFYDSVYDEDGDDSVMQEPEDDDEGNDSDDGMQDPANSSLASKGSSCKVIRKESLLAAQKEDLQRVMELMPLKEHHARTLLIHYRWNVDGVFTDFAERGKEWLYKTAGLPLRSSKELSFSMSSAEVTCEICFEEVPANDSTLMECGHYFCNNCWTEHFIVKINEGQSRRITCMAHKCSAICDEESVRNLVSVRDPALAAKFDRFLLESYIDDNNRVKWCPSIPHCGNAIRIDEDEYCEVECACGKEFCFSCTAEAHSPCSCLMWERWSKKCQDESETVNWITANTKHCPKCHKPVEKNGGCNLVYCLCGQAFCWLCGGATGLKHTWTSIEGHTCGRYKEDELENIERAKKQLFRYSHYYNRYKAHKDSLQLENKLKERLREKIVALEEKDMDSRDFSWVTTGFSRLCRSRKIISYSYPFAYYMFGDDLFNDGMTAKEREMKQNLFEEQQQQLEAMTERLSLFLEEPFADYPGDELLKTKLKILDLCSVTDNYCRRLYDCIENDLLDPIQEGTHIIAPYRSRGVEKASELS